MQVRVSHNNANSQAESSHYNAIALQCGSASLRCMTKADKRDKVATRQRAAIRTIMAKRGLKMLPWCVKAGISESTLRNFLNGDSDSIGTNNAELLANAAGIGIGELLGEEIHYRADDDLMLRAAQAISRASKAKGLKLSRDEEMSYIVVLYNHIIEYRRTGSDVSPNEAMADLILNQKMA